MIEVLGNSLASLLVFDYLTSKNIPCNYYFQRNIPVGGHFRGIKKQRNVFDSGTVLIEPLVYPRNSEKGTRFWRS
jgi:hypothetical protein